jgi:hypothetical protein
MATLFGRENCPPWELAAVRRLVKGISVAGVEDDEDDWSAAAADDDDDDDEAADEARAVAAAISDSTFSIGAPNELNNFPSLARSTTTR